MSNGADHIVWNYPDSYREGHASVGDYMLFIHGGRQHEFAWMLSYKGSVIVDSGNDPCRSTSEARRIVEAMYKMHSYCLDYDKRNALIYQLKASEIF